MATPAQERILLFIPAYNCERQISRVIAQLEGEARNWVNEVIVVNNRSTDATEARAVDALRTLPDLRGKVLRNDGNYGLGGSHKVAFNYARANGFDYCVTLHGDDQGSIADLIPHLARGAHREVDCLLGARFMRGSKLAGYSLFRTIGNHAFNLLYSAVSGRWITDLGSGLSLYAVRALDDSFYLRCADDLTFNYHMLLRSIAMRWRIRFFPLEWRESDQTSNVKLMRQALRVLGIALSYGLTRQRYLTSNYAAAAAQGVYSSTVIFDTTSAEAAIP
jgi:glycosyltransferase involved in cell wall biosynthesis